MAVGRIETLIVFPPIAVVVTLVAYAFSSTYSENAARDVSAKESGFDNYAEQSRAKASGYVNASGWHAEVAAAAERAAAEEDRRRKDWEAKAPERAAQAAKEEADAEVEVVQKN